MSKIAIDIVLLPSDEMMDKAVEVSKRQSEKHSKKILLNKEDCLPHISLAMGAVAEDKIPEIARIINEIASQFSVMKLSAEKYKGKEIPSGEIVSEFEIGKTEELQKLHETVMNRLKLHLTYDVTLDMVYSPPSVDELTLYWIKGYPQKSSFENFKPHITTGFGEVDSVITPVAFTASKLAICHLGNFCTCRKILVSSGLMK